MAYVIHFALDCAAQGILYMAYKHVCRKPWHRAAIWLLGTAAIAVVTVDLVG